MENTKKENIELNIKELNIYEKLGSVMGSVDKVEKKGWNAFHKYKYVYEADLIEVVKKALIEYRLILLSSVEELIHHNDLTDVKVKYTIINADNPEEKIEIWGRGTGQDKGDKGVYKAITGSMKYFLMKNFLIPTGDDPEAHTPKRTYKPKTDNFKKQQDNFEPSEFIDNVSGSDIPVVNE